MIDKTREIALKTLYKIDKEEAYSNIELNEQIKQNRKNLTEKDIGLISEIVYGVTTWRLTLDEIIKKYSKIKIKKISPWIINILRMGIYQIIFLDKIPKSAAVNESVELAKHYGNKGSVGFVNAILRKIDKKDYEDFFNIKDTIKRISLTTSMPEWIIEELLKQKSENQVEQICKNSNLRPDLTIRINTLKITQQELERELKARKIRFEETDIPNFLKLKKQKSIENLDLFKEGYFTVQDLSAGLVSTILNPKENERILDCCSAPGGKTTHLAEIMKNKGTIEAWDIHEHRIKLIEENAKRLGINIINTKIQDATEYDKNLKEKYDKILLDVPCLGIGVIKRKPDIKWQRKQQDIEEITKIQFEILKNCSKYLKKGGELVYSTCSILKEENQEIIEKFLKENDEFIYGDYKNVTNYDIIDKFLIDNKYLEIDTNSNYDGFFICKLVKKMV